MDLALLLTVCSTVFLASLLGTKLLLGFLRRRQIMDIPNQRSNHTMPTPRGAGLAVIGSLVIGWGVWYAFYADALHYLPFFVIASSLTAFSFLDDIKNLPASLRFLVQALVVGVSLAFFTSHGLVFQGLLPTYLDKVFTALLWLWFINLYNFMDGIDGITGIETLCIGVGLAALSLFIPDYAVEFGYIGLMLAASVLGFLVWNWHPAKIFLGDSGSVSLGYLLGWLLIELAMAGYWQAALIIPGYYLFDSSFTLARRILRREKFWQAHSQHFYQKAVRRGISPRTVVSLLFITNVILIALAWATAHNLLLWWAPAFALAFIISLIVVLLRLKPRTL